MLEAPTLEVTFFGQPATVRGFGTYRPGPFDDPTGNRSEELPRCSLTFDGVKVNGVLYSGRLDFKKYPDPSGFVGRVGWCVEWNPYIRRQDDNGRTVGASEPTNKARRATMDAGQALIRELAEKQPGFFEVTAEAHAIRQASERALELLEDYAGKRRQLAEFVAKLAAEKDHLGQMLLFNILKPGVTPAERAALQVNPGAE